MGVDFTIIKTTGLLIDLDGVGEVPEDLAYDLDSDDFRYDSQDLYGTSSFSPYGIIYNRNDATVIYDVKVGGTPFSFMKSGVYPNTETLRGGASIPLVVTMWDMTEYLQVVDAEKRRDECIEQLGKCVSKETLEWIKKNTMYGEYLFSYFH